jgi:hypothetical protein
MLAIGGLVLAACTNEPPESAENAVSGQGGAADQSFVAHCFRNEYPIDDTRDLEELVVEVRGSRATGEYNWLPAYKDRRVGRFTGALEEGVIDARYEYRQEGTTGTARISIALEDHRAVVRGGPPELGLERTLARVEC